MSKGPGKNTLIENLLWDIQRQAGMPVNDYYEHLLMEMAGYVEKRSKRRAAEIAQALLDAYNSTWRSMPMEMGIGPLCERVISWASKKEST